MASMFEQPRNGTLFLGGQKISGSDIRDQNGMFVVFVGFMAAGYLADPSCEQFWLRKRSRMSSRAPLALAVSTR
jgi:hypothetical protein